MLDRRHFAHVNDYFSDGKLLTFGINFGSRDEMKNITLIYLISVLMEQDTVFKLYGWQLISIVEMIGRDRHRMSVNLIVFLLSIRF